MSVGKDKLWFDPTSIPDSDTIGSFIVGKTGNVITSTTISGIEALDVNIASPISVDVDLDGIYNLTTNPTPDNVGNIFFVRNAAPGLAQQTFTATGAQANADSVVAANVFAQDANSFLMGYNGSTWDRIHSTSGSLDVNVTNTLSINDAALANVALLHGAVVVGTSAVAMPASPLANRKYLLVQNLGNKSLYIGASGVTAADGFRLSPNAYGEFRIGSVVSLYGISTAAAQDIRVLELS